MVPWKQKLIRSKLTLHFAKMGTIVYTEARTVFVSKDKFHPGPRLLYF
jgi:hypothetical protein